MKSFVNFIPIVVAVIIFLSPSLAAQDTYILDQAVTAKIQGTSTLHGWESVIEDTDLKLSAVTSKSSVRITDLKLTVSSVSIKSGKDVMDQKTYTALKAEEFPTISFELTDPAETDNDGNVTAKGTLNLIGIEKDIEVKGKVTKDVDERLMLNASYTINMTDYGITPPSAMFGTIETGEEVTVVFDLKLSNSPSLN
ncbi:MAG: YceI family protein [Bacteroidota bacterium]